MAPTRIVLVLALGCVVGCGDDAADGGASTDFTQTVPRPATEVDPFAFERDLRVDWHTRIDVVRLAVGGATLDAIERIDVRLATTDDSSQVIDLFDPTLSGGATAQRIPVPSGVAVAQFSGYAPTDDFDGDLVDNTDDNCPQTQNATQSDGDGDGVGEACDTDDADPAIGPSEPAAGLPPVRVEVRVFAHPDEVPEGGFTLTVTLQGEGVMEFVL